MYPYPLLFANIGVMTLLNGQVCKRSIDVGRQSRQLQTRLT
jgi:hypothetical protein